MSSINFKPIWIFPQFSRFLLKFRSSYAIGVCVRASCLLKFFVYVHKMVDATESKLFFITPSCCAWDLRILHTWGVQSGIQFSRQSHPSCRTDVLDIILSFILLFDNLEVERLIIKIVIIGVYFIRFLCL